MSLKSFRDTLVRLLSLSERQDNKLDVSSAPSEQSRLLHRLNCINLDDEEAKTLEGYLTTILEARHQEKGYNSNLKSNQDVLCLRWVNQNSESLLLASERTLSAHSVQ
jgi:hypothetical protein